MELGANAHLPKQSFRNSMLQAVSISCLVHASPGIAADVSSFVGAGGQHLHPMAQD